VIGRLSPVPIRSRKFAVSCSVDAAEACSTDTTKWNDFDQVGESLLVDARLMLAFTSEAPN